MFPLFWNKIMTETEMRSVYVLKTIQLSDIEHYKNDGEVYRETEIYGGGGGVDVSGAMIGSVIAVDTGAIIGSRQKVNDIQSRLITHDTRKVVFTYFQNGERKTMIFKCLRT